MTERELLPQGPALERSLLGGIFTAPDILAEVAGIVKARDFHDPRNRTIYRAMQATNGGVPDLLTVTSLLEQRGPQHR